VTKPKIIIKKSNFFITQAKKLISVDMKIDNTMLRDSAIIATINMVERKDHGIVPIKNFMQQGSAKIATSITTIEKNDSRRTLTSYQNNTNHSNQNFKSPSLLSLHKRSQFKVQAHLNDCYSLLL
jgi:tmRNA-binding protein